MSLGYQKGLSFIGFKQIKTVPDIPDMRLMVGSAEHLQSFPLVLYKNYQYQIPEPLQRPINQMKAEDVKERLNGVEFTTDDFVNNTFYLGNAIDGGMMSDGY